MIPPPALWFAVVLAAAAPDEPAEKLVRRLGDDSYEAREQAAERLLELGASARPALEAATADDDLEIALRARLLLETLALRELDDRLADLRAGKAVDRSGLPLWKLWVKAAGDDAASATLYAEAVAAAPELFVAASADPESEGSRRTAEWLVVQQGRIAAGGDAKADFAAAVLFLGGMPQLRVEGLSVAPVAQLLRTRPEVREAFGAGDRAGPLGRLLVHWVRRKGNRYQLRLLEELKVAGAAAAAIEIAGETGESAHLRGSALLVAGRTGDPSLLPSLVRFLDDETTVGNYTSAGVRSTTRLGDVALAAAVRLTGQNAEEYGFAHQAAGVTTSATLCGFTDDKKREAALRRWKEWSAKQPAK
jgi:hypothetical protein